MAISEGDEAGAAGAGDWVEGIEMSRAGFTTGSGATFTTSASDGTGGAATGEGLVLFVTVFGVGTAAVFEEAMTGSDFWIAAGCVVFVGGGRGGF